MGSGACCSVSLGADARQDLRSVKPGCTRRQVVLLVHADNGTCSGCWRWMRRCCETSVRVGAGLPAVSPDAGVGALRVCYFWLSASAGRCSRARWTVMPHSALWRTHTHSRAWRRQTRCYLSTMERSVALACHCLVCLPMAGDHTGLCAGPARPGLQNKGDSQRDSRGTP